MINSGKIRKHAINRSAFMNLRSISTIYGPSLPVRHTKSDVVWPRRRCHGIIHSKQSKVSSLSSYQLSINKLTAALKKSKQISIKETVHTRTDLNIARKEKVESSERNQTAKLFELVD